MNVCGFSPPGHTGGVLLKTGFLLRQKNKKGGEGCVCVCVRGVVAWPLSEINLKC